MKIVDEELYQAAVKALDRSYSVYSHFRVGAAARLKDGRIITGANMENSSYGLTLCAERVCIFRSRMEGAERENFVSFCITGDTDDPISPCGACRQVMYEMLPHETPVYLTNLKGDCKVMTVDELLPYFPTDKDIQEHA